MVGFLVSVALAYLATEFPWLGPVLLILTLLGILGTVVRFVRSKSKLKTVGLVAAGMLAGLLVSGVVAAAVPRANPMGGAPDVTDPTGICVGCRASMDVETFAYRPAGTGVTFLVRLAGQPAPGDEYHIWFRDASVMPMRVMLTDDGWRFEIPTPLPFRLEDVTFHADGHDVGLRIAKDPGALTFVTQAGDRVPDHGWLRPGGRVEVSTEGYGRTLEGTVEGVQAGFASLTETQRELAIMLLGRHAEGTRTYATVSAASDVGFVTTETANRSAWRLTSPAVGLGVSAQASWTCAPACVGGLSDGLPLDAAFTLVRFPGEIAVADVGVFDINGQPGRCVRVESTIPYGPARGDYCRDARGVLVLHVDVDAQRFLRLTADTHAVAAGAFTPPGGVGLS